MNQPRNQHFILPELVFKPMNMVSVPDVKTATQISNCHVKTASEVTFGGESCHT